MRSTTVAVVVLCAATGITLAAKGPTVTLTIAPMNGAPPIHITAGDALVHVWSDDFLGPIAREPGAALERYQIAFHVLPNRSRAVQVMYVVMYARNTATGENFVYLPGRGEEHYSLNVSTILRGHEGRWHRAVPKWADAVNRSLRDVAAQYGVADPDNTQRIHEMSITRLAVGLGR
jgi:hypothetical protein